MSKSRLGLAISAVAIALVSLTACGSPAAPAASSAPAKPTASVTPTATAAAPSTTAERLVLTGDGFSLVDDQETILAAGAWTAAAPGVSETLENAFGTAPEIVERAGDGYHYPPKYSVFVWPGFELSEFAGEDGASQLVFTATVAEANGITIESRSGAKVGMTVENALSLNPYHRADHPNLGPMLFFDPVASSDTEPYATSGVRADTDGGVITRLAAPASDAL